MRPVSRPHTRTQTRTQTHTQTHTQTQTRTQTPNIDLNPVEVIHDLRARLRMLQMKFDFEEKKGSMNYQRATNIAQSLNEIEKAHLLLMQKFDFLWDCLATRMEPKGSTREIARLKSAQRKAS